MSAQNLHDQSLIQAFLQPLDDICIDCTVVHLLDPQVIL